MINGQSELQQRSDPDPDLSRGAGEAVQFTCSICQGPGANIECGVCQRLCHEVEEDAESDDDTQCSDGGVCQDCHLIRFIRSLVHSRVRA